MSFTDLTEQEKQQLREVARQSIDYGLKHDQPLPVSVENYSPLLQQQAATFVTLNLHGQLRGCIGTLQAYQPLIKDVAQHAYDSAFRDRRFSPVTEGEAPELEIHISILTPDEPIEANSEAELLSRLRPGIDGLILKDGPHQATFLPAVWEQLPAPEDFLAHLKIKAGLARNHWSDSIVFSRYQAVSV